MPGAVRRTLLTEAGLAAVGVVIGGIVAFLLPFLCLFVVPISFGWFAGGGTRENAYFYARPATALGIGAVGATTFITTFTLGWDRASQEWIVYAFLGMMTVYWLSYAGMRWLHTASGH